MNLYRYCGGNPINHSDPTGLYVAALTGWGGGDWTDGSGLSAWDRNQGGMPSNRPQAGMDGGGGARDMAGHAEANIGSMKYHNTRNWYGREVNHCNEFPADMAEASGRSRPQVWVEPGYGKGDVGHRRDAVSNELANPKVKIPHWSSPKPFSEARRNDIIAQQHGKGGHTGVVVAPGRTITVDTTKGGVVAPGNWGYRAWNGEGKGDPPPVVRHYIAGSYGEW
jgi:hypothetical protein